MNAVRATISHVARNVPYRCGSRAKEIPNVEYDAAVTLGCGDECPFVRAKRREDWGIPDPRDMKPDEFRAVRDLIESKVKELLTSLQA